MKKYFNSLFLILFAGLLYSADNIQIVPNGTVGANSVAVANQKIEVSTVSAFLYISSGAIQASSITVNGSQVLTSGVNGVTSNSTQTWTAQQTFLNLITVSTSINITGNGLLQASTGSFSNSINASSMTINGVLVQSGSNGSGINAGGNNFGVLVPSMTVFASTWTFGGITVQSSSTFQSLVSISSTLFVNSDVAFSTPPLMHAGGYNSTLAQNTTFFSFVPDGTIRLRRITATIVVAGTGGSGDTWICGDGVNQLSVVSPSAASAGSIATATSNVYVVAGSTVAFLMRSGASPTPTANVTCEYGMR